ncbi:MAG: acyl carrier protein [Oligoflexales bacterium]|nr:acyl carrier protein [Oligoflexales bacterium]
MTKILNISRREEIYSRIVGSLVQVCGVSVVSKESLLTSDLGIDSLKIAELSIAFEDEFGFSCFLPDILNCDSPYKLTVNSLVDFIEEKMKENNS